MYEMESYTVAVIGAGHAGVEAALSCARMGCKTVLFTISLDQIANMPCNPSIGGTAKGQAPEKWWRYIYDTVYPSL